MTEHWTRFDPGAGDTSQCADAAAWCNSRAAELEEIEQVISTLLWNLDDNWRGSAADALSDRLSDIKKEALKHISALYAAAKAFNLYKRCR